MVFFRVYFETWYYINNMLGICFTGKLSELAYDVAVLLFFHKLLPQEAG